MAELRRSFVSLASLQNGEGNVRLNQFANNRQVNFSTEAVWHFIFYRSSELILEALKVNEDLPECIASLRLIEIKTVIVNPRK